MNEKQDEMVTITVSRATAEKALTALLSVAHDPQEPDRYQRWYQEAADELSAALD